MMGHPYPVIESPVDKDNLLGKECKVGFNSHYVVVKKSTGMAYFPCKPTETPDYDEIVVFSKNQILPRYLIYYNVVKSNVGTGVDTTVPVPLDIRDSIIIMLWVDDKLNGENKELHSRLLRLVHKLHIVVMTSTEELLVWLKNYGSDTIHKLKIVTNRYRELDGKEKAADDLISKVRSVSSWNQIPIAVYCSNPALIPHLHDPKKQLTVTNKATDIMTLVSHKK